MSEYIWETFDSLFRTVNRQDQRTVELEARVAELERRLSERAMLREVPQPTLTVEREMVDEFQMDEFQEKRAA